MPDNPTTPPSNQPDTTQNATPATAPKTDGPSFGHLSMAEEMDSAKWTLPPLVPLVVGLLLVAIAVTVVMFATKDKPIAALAITKVVSTPQDENTMVAIQVKFDNQLAGPLWIKEIRADVETADGKKFSDLAAPAVDGPKLMQAFPALEEAKADWLQGELKIPPKSTFNGVAIFSYPVSKQLFDGRKQVTLHVQLYDHDGLRATDPPSAAK
jgi:hypothetical protein